jgi:hypothetical protein
VRHPGPRATVIRSRGSYQVVHGTGRRRQEARFGCVACSDVSITDPRCRCRAAAVSHARLLGSGATVIRGEAAIHLEP